MQEIIKKCLPTYEVISKIGEGVYGSVFHVKDNLKERAVKVVPIMIERSVLFRTEDDLDSKINAVREFMAKEDPSQTWTSYHRLLGRHFYMGHGSGETPKD